MKIVLPSAINEKNGIIIAIGRNIGFKLSGSSTRPEYVGFLIVEETVKNSKFIRITILHRHKKSTAWIHFYFTSIERKSSRKFILIQMNSTDDFYLAAWLSLAVLIVNNCWATTERTSTSIRLNLKMIDALNKKRIQRFEITRRNNTKNLIELNHWTFCPVSDR